MQDDDERPKKKSAHDLGQDLSLLSIEELRERVAVLQAEIARIEAAVSRKTTSRSVADQVFKK